MGKRKVATNNAEVIACLDRVNGVWTRAAEELGCSEATIRRRARELNYTPKPKQVKLRTLFIDVETSPNVAHLWSLWHGNVGLSQLRESSRLLCFAARWKGERGTIFKSEFHDKRADMVRTAHELLSQADAVVHYNGNRFDIPVLNREFLMYELSPPQPQKQIDLYAAVKGKFHFPSYKLDYVAQALGYPGKTKHTGHDMWVKCLTGDPAAWEQMKKYNIQDVALLEDVYARLLPWISNHPNVGLFTGRDDACPNCGSDNLTEQGYSRTSVSAYQQYQCEDCGMWIRSGKREYGVELRAVK